MGTNILEKPAASIFRAEEGGSRFLQNVGTCLPNYTASHPIRMYDYLIFGPMQAKGVWRIRYNKEIKKLYDDVILSRCLCLRTLQWAGQMVRMDDSCIPT
jgi:hypothetical protein